MAENKIKSPLERDYWFDNVKAFLIISVVVGHLANGTFSTATDWVRELQRFIYVFHMPAFMIVSGRFAKKRIDKGDWPTVISKMVVPYLIFQTAFLVLYSALYATPGKFNYLNPLFGLWYFANVAVYSIITTHLKKFKWLFPASLVAALLVGYSQSELYGGFHRIVCFYPFFLFGYYTSNMDFSFCKKVPFRIISVIAFGALGLYMLNHAMEHSWGLLCMNQSYGDIVKDMARRGFEWTKTEALLHCMLRYLVGFAGFFVILGLMPTKKWFFSYIGSNSVYVYVLHCMLIVILRELDKDYDLLRVLTDKWRLLIYCFSGIPLSFILASKPVRKLTRWFVAPNFDLARIVKRLAGTEEKEVK